MVNITPDPIDPSKVYELIDAGAAGSVVFHYATVKPLAGDGGTTCHIDYSADGDAETELRMIADALAAEFSLIDVLLVRRTGRLGLGEIISLVAAAAPGSEAAFEACRQGISRVRRMRSFTKHEVCG
jgi:molybdopterin synthase catalytic subunit